MGSRGTTFALVAALTGLLNALPAAADEVTPRPGPDVEPVPVEELTHDTPDYDPWAPFNERMFTFNHRVLDRFIMKPLARAWDWVLPDSVRRSFDHAFDNLDMPRRIVNHLLQARPRAAGAEAGRFVVNSTVGVAGLIDVAGRIGIHASDADTGQTLGVWGFGQGPYLVLPFLPPLTVRDGIGRGVDGILDPVGSLVPVPLAVSLSVTAVRRVNERSLQPAAFENVEETVIDLYSAVRNAHLHRRRSAVLEGRRDSLCPCLRARAVPPMTPVR